MGEGFEETDNLLGDSPKQNGTGGFYGAHQNLVAARISGKGHAKEGQAKKIGVLQLFRYADTTDKLLLALGSFFAFIHGAGLPVLALVFGQMTNTFIQQATMGFASSNMSITQGPLLANQFDVKVMAPMQMNSTDTLRDATGHDVTFQPTPNVTAESLITPSVQNGLTVEEFAAYMTEFSLYYVYIGLAVLVASFLQVLCWEVSCERQIYRLRQEFFYQVLRQEIGWFDTHQTGDLTTKLQDDLERVRDGIGHKFSMVMQFICTFLTGFIVGFFVSWKLTLIILSLTPILAATSAFTGRMMASSSAREQEKYGQAGAVADEVISCIRTVVSFGGQKREIKRYEDALEQGRAMAVRKYVVFSWGIAIVFLVMYSAYALAFWYGSELLAKGELDPGTIFTVFFSVLVGAFSLGNAVPYMSSIGIAQGAAAVSYGIIDSIPFIDPYSKWGDKPEKVCGKIEFRKISFSYPTRKQVQILLDFSLTLEPGQTVALVGPSGSGKSTVVSLLLRYYDPDQGQVMLDGRDIRNINLATLRHHIGVVSQEPVLFASSIAENIRYGRDDVTWDEIVRAAKMANAHSFIQSLPHGYDTLVGERGAQLSGGQKQRIAIARALVRNPKILLLDEATSALDAHSEGIVQAALNKAQEGRTTIIIAHRLSTIKDANCIYVMHNGEVEEKGTHQELMNQEGLYHELVTSQTTNEASGFSSDTGAASGYNSAPDEEIFEKVGVRRRKSRSTSRVDSIPDRDLERLEMEAEEEEIREPSVLEILKVNLPEWPYLFMGVMGAGIMGGIMPAFAFFYSEMFATFTKTGEALQQAAFFWSMMFLVLAAGSGLGAWLRTVGLAVAGECLTMRLRLMSFMSVIRQSVGWFDEELHSGGRITTRLARDAPIVKQAAGHRVGLMLTAVVTMVAAMVIAFVFGWKLALVVMVGFPVLAIAGYIQFKIQRGGQRKDAELLEEAGRIANESLQNVRTVQALTQERLFFEKFLDSLLPAYIEARKQAYVYGAIFAFSEAVTFFMYAAAFRFGAYLVEIGESDPTSIYRVFFAISFCAVSVGQTTAFMPDYTKAKLAAGLMFSLIEMKPIIDAFSTSGNKPVIQGKVTFHDVHFSYPARPGVAVLKGVNLTVETGRSLALVGPSGCGKSTIVSLLQRFYDPQHGSLAVDNFDIRSINLAHLRSHMGLVTQEPVLFDCSIHDNIAYGVEGDVTDEAVIKAARVANIHNFICGLPRGYDTVVGERGTQLSGGQKQRIAIARALIRDPKILLLDEATSALDTENEKIVQEALDVAMKGRTCIMIAHRLSTVQNADCIAVLDRGRIVEMGTHEELRAKRGLYYRLTKRQQIEH